MRYNEKAMKRSRLISWAVHKFHKRDTLLVSKEAVLEGHETKGENTAARGKLLAQIRHVE